MIMPQTDIKIVASTKDLKKLSQLVTTELDKGGYNFLSISFPQQMIFCHTREEKLALIRDFVTLEEPPEDK